jgi:hypothetical protein
VLLLKRYIIQYQSPFRPQVLKNGTWGYFFTKKFGRFIIFSYLYIVKQKEIRLWECFSTMTKSTTAEDTRVLIYGSMVA